MNKSFTLLELLIVIGILSAISVIVVIAVDPVEQLNKARDVKRMTELSQIRDAILLYISENNTLPTTSTNSLSNNTNLDGTGWIPIDFTKITIGKPLPYLPLDPKNNSNNYYTFISDGKYFEINTNLESKTYKDKMTNDGGDDDTKYQNTTFPYTKKGFVGAWFFNEGQGTKTFDISGNNNNGTLGTDSIWVEGKNAYGLGATTESNILTVPDIDFSSAYTFVIWSKATGAPNLFGRWPSSPPRSGAIYIANSRTDVRFYDSNCGWDTQIMINGTKNTMDGNWHHIALTYNGSDAYLYVDGVQDGSDLGNNGVCNCNISWTIGTGVRGIIDTALMYNRALSAEEISTLYNSTK